MKEMTVAMIVGTGAAAVVPRRTLAQLETGR